MPDDTCVYPQAGSNLISVYDSGSRRALEVRSEGSIPSTLTNLLSVSKQGVCA